MDTYIVNDKKERMAIHVSTSPLDDAPVVLIEHGIAGI